MAKPPPTAPNSDIEGVHREERRNTDVAADRGESAEEVDEAKRGDAARPPQSSPNPPSGTPY